MNKIILYIILLIISPILIADTNIDSNNKYAWSDNIGWLKLSGENWGVIHDGKGNLSAYPWNPNFGWIMFKTDHSQVKINLETGDFNGYAWSYLIGWRSFNGRSYKVQANLPPVSTSLGAAILIAGSGAHKQFRQLEKIYAKLEQFSYLE